MQRVLFSSTRFLCKALITAPDRTQLNSTQLVELSLIGRCDHNLRTQLNSTDPFVASSVILNIWLCVQLS